MSIFTAWGSRLTLKAAPSRRAISMADRKQETMSEFSGEDARQGPKHFLPPVCIASVTTQRNFFLPIPEQHPVYAGAFAYGRTSTRSDIIEGRSGKTAGNGVPMEQWVGTISFWYSTG